ncbi:hypothetical protein [Streptomyces sp. NRRL S-1813]|uniref:hypothetical protein n=1 Tax=Streptomyces sp. NRRL S-1813 TaxID=1463888 RepID=UPI0007C4B70D|nr:hypothetical protein [Streptomyces sp. NRRL S-1813]
MHIALFHAHYPLIAFVGGRRYWYTGQFQEPPAWAGVLADVGFVVLSAARLLSPLVESDTSALSAAERRQIERWRPETLGATLFNSWDWPALMPSWMPAFRVLLGRAAAEASTRAPAGFPEFPTRQSERW